jgi:hypothetical protein
MQLPKRILRLAPQSGKGKLETVIVQLFACCASKTWEKFLAISTSPFMQLSSKNLKTRTGPYRVLGSPQ